MGAYIESTDRPNQSRIAGSDVDVGEAVVVNSNQKAEPFDGSSHNLGDFAGVADDPLTGDQIAADEDDTGGFTYLASEDDRVVFGGDADDDVIKLRTAEDTGGNEPTPDISDGDVVGFIDHSAGTISSTSEYEGRIVEEGYEDGESTATTYNRSNSNFTAIGHAYRDDANAYDGVVRIEVDKALQQSNNN